MDKKKFEVIGPDHPISKIADDLSTHAFELAGGSKISRMDLCIAFACTCGQILADSKDMPRDVALGRMDDLRTVMEGAYDLRDVRGEG